jgi:hypothetical protein
MQALGDMDVSHAADGNVMLDDGTGAGAYVHGLEDEFEAVRLAAIDSLCELSLNTPTVAHKAAGYLVRLWPLSLASRPFGASLHPPSNWAPTYQPVCVCVCGCGRWT